MKTLIHRDSFIVQFMTNVADLVIINFLLIIFSLPVFTVGTAITAAECTLLNLKNDTGSGTVAMFFNFFKKTFRKSTIIWLITITVYFSFLCDYMLASAYFSSAMVNYVSIVLVALVIVSLAFLSWIFPMIGMFSCSIQEHSKNAVRLMLSRLPKTGIIVLIKLLPVFVFICFPGLIAYTWIFWLLIGFSLIFKLCNYAINPVFDELRNKS